MNESGSSAPPDRPRGPISAFGVKVLNYLEERGFAGAPRVLDKPHGERPVLTHLEGEVLTSPAVATSTQLVTAGQILRQVHDLLAESPLRDEEETVIHGDAGLHNIVFQGDRAVGLFDWEFCQPGSRVSEVADVSWSFFDSTWNAPEQERAAGTIGLRVADFLLGYDWDDITAVFEEIKRQMAKALDDHREHGYEESVAYFERQTAWLAENELEFLAAAGSGTQY